MGWRRFQTLQSQTGKDATYSDTRSDRTPSGSSSSEGSSRKSEYSTNTQKGLTFAFPKWAGAARGVTTRILSNGENLMRELVEAPKWLTPAKSRRTSIASIPELDDHFTTFLTCLSSTMQALDQHADGLVTSPTQIVSPTPTWDTINMGHPNYENETHVPIFSGWASFCGVHTPPILVPRTHWDDTVAGNKQARLDEMDLSLATSVTVTSWKKQKEPVCTGTVPQPGRNTRSPGPVRVRAVSYSHHAASFGSERIGFD